MFLNEAMQRETCSTISVTFVSMGKEVLKVDDMTFALNLGRNHTGACSCVVGQKTCDTIGQAYKVDGVRIVHSCDRHCDLLPLA